MSALIEQRRARFTLEQVARWKERKQLTDKLEAAANSLPALILMNGLGQAAAHSRSQKDAPHWRALYQALSDWLCGQGGEGDKARNPHPVYPGQTDLLSALTRGGMEEYRAAQAEALAFLQWLKNAVRAETAGG